MRWTTGYPDQAALQAQGTRVETTLLPARRCTLPYFHPAVRAQRMGGCHENRVVVGLGYAACAGNGAIVTA
jgi:hypothetical protein